MKKIFTKWGLTCQNCLITSAHSAQRTAHISHNSAHKNTRPASKWRGTSNGLHWLLLRSEPRNFLYSLFLAFICIGITAFWLLLIAVLFSCEPQDGGASGSSRNIAAPPAVIRTLSEFPDGSKIQEMSNSTRHLDIRASVTKLKSKAFQNRGLDSVTIPSKVTAIGKSAFSGNRLTSLIIPDSVRLIEDSAFKGNWLTSLTIGSNVEKIGIAAFQGNQLTSLIIPDSVTYIGIYAFNDNRLISLTIGPNVEEIGGAAFRRNRLTSLIIPDSVTSLGVNAFLNNRLTEVILSNELYKDKADVFDSTGIKFYEYDASKPDNKGKKLN